MCFKEHKKIPCQPYEKSIEKPLESLLENQFDNLENQKPNSIKKTNDLISIPNEEQISGNKKIKTFEESKNLIDQFPLPQSTLELMRTSPVIISQLKSTDLQNIILKILNSTNPNETLNQVLGSDSNFNFFLDEVLKKIGFKEVS